MLYEFEDYSAVRDLLGVSDKELTDTTLGGEVPALMLELDLNKVSALLDADYAAAQTVHTSSANLFKSAFRVFTVYAMAYYCLDGLPGFSPKSITDGKAGFSRFADSPYKETIARVQAGLARYRQDLAERYATYKGTTATVFAPSVGLGISTPDYDPVTG